MKDAAFRAHLTRTDDDVVNGDEDQLHKESNKAHDHESDCGTDGHLREFWAHNLITEKKERIEYKEETPQIRTRSKWIQAMA